MSTSPTFTTQASQKLRTIKAGEFKATCLGLLDEVALRDQPLAITKHGKVVAHLIAPPEEPKPFRSIIGRSARPGARVPTPEEWAKHKAEWAQEWEQSFERRAALLTGGKREKQAE